MRGKVETKHSSFKKDKSSEKHGKFRHDADYIAYIENGKSGAVFITRDVAEKIDTKGKWVDIIEIECNKRYRGQNEYKFFIVELFNKREHPKYEKGMTAQAKKYLTWQVATNDIASQRDKGICGEKYIVLPKLILKNAKGEHRTLALPWDTRYKMWVRTWEFSSDCIWKDRLVYVVTSKEEWKYQIVAFKKISDTELEYIRNNYFEILSNISKKQTPNLVDFNLK